MSDTEAVRTVGGAVAERPRRVRRYPLLQAIYERHDELIERHATGRTLEVAHGQHHHAAADVAVDIHRPNAAATGADTVGIAADARGLPFEDGAFETVIGRRFLHHVPRDERRELLAECARVCSGRLVLIEGTPGAYRRLTKGVGALAGVVEPDEYEHCTPEALRAHCEAVGKPLVCRPLGSPVMPAAALPAEGARRLAGLVDRTQWVRWWTLAVVVVGDG